MENPGEYLKKERELRGVSIEDLSRSMRLSVDILTLLETDNFEKLPHRTFVRGYIKSYCKELGLDNTEAILRYEQYLRDSGDEDIRSTDIFVGDTLGKGTPVGAYGVSTLVFVVLIAFLYFFMTNVKIEEREVAKVEDVQIDGDLGDGLGVDKTTTLKVIKKVEDSPLVQMATTEHILGVTAESTTWISVEVDPDTEKHQNFEVTLEAGEKVSWKATKVFFWS